MINSSFLHDLYNTGMTSRIYKNYNASGIYSAFSWFHEYSIHGHDVFHTLYKQWNYLVKIRKVIRNSVSIRDRNIVDREFAYPKILK